MSIQGNSVGGLIPTAEQVGARPNTWTPTAAQVGAVPTSRTVNGKELSSNISLTASDVGAPTEESVDYVISEIQTQINKKQNLIGISSYAGDLNNYETLRNTVCWVNGSAASNSPSDYYGVVETWSNGSAIIVQRYTTINRSVAIRMYYNGAWTPWEWINPLMIVGKEYRTTERHNGKVKYCKLCSCGALVSAGHEKRVSLGTEAMTSIVSHSGYVVSDSGAPISFPIYASTGVIGYHIVGNESAAYIVCNGDGSSYTSSYIEVWYTKD